MRVGEVLFTDQECQVDGRSLAAQPVILVGDTVDEPSTAWLLHCRRKRRLGSHAVARKAYALSEWLNFLWWRSGRGYAAWTDSTDALLLDWGNSMLGSVIVQNINLKINDVARFLVWAQSHRFSTHVAGVNDLARSSCFPVSIEAERYDEATGIVSPNSSCSSTVQLAGTYSRSPITLPTDKQIRKFGEGISAYYLRDGHGGDLSEALHERDHLMFQVMLDVGLRREELVNLTVDQIPTAAEAQDAIIEKRMLRFTVVGKGKGDGKKREVEAHPQLILQLRNDFIDGWRRELLASSGVPEDEWPTEVFVTTRGEALKPKSVTDLFAIMSRFTGVKITPHLLRHVFATNRVSHEMALQKELNGGFFDDMTVIAAVQDVLGHSSIETTMKYLHLAKSAIRTRELESKGFAAFETDRLAAAKIQRLEARLAIVESRQDNENSTQRKSPRSTYKGGRRRVRKS